MGLFSDLGDFASNTWDSLENAGQGLVDWGKDAGQSLIDAHKDVGAGVDDLRRGDISGFEDRAADFEDRGEDIFGDGSWYKAAFNAAVTGGNPFAPYGNVGYKLVHGQALNKADYASLGVNAAMPSFETGYGRVADSAARGASSGAVNAAIQGKSVAEGAATGGLYGGISGGLNAYLNPAQSNLSITNLGDSSMDGGFNWYDFNSPSGRLDDFSDMSAWTPSDTQSSTWLDTWKSIKDTDWMKGIFGALGGTSAGGAAAAKGMYGTGDQVVNTIAGLANLGLQHSAAKKYGQYADNLASMYGPNSAYSKQLQSSLAARDAARGRRSQYGARNVELQAKLADVNARIAPQMMAAQNAQRQAQLGGLQSIYGLAKNYGPQINTAWNNFTNPATMKGYSGDPTVPTFMGPNMPEDESLRRMWE
jgi:hypothetical protein